MNSDNEIVLHVFLWVLQYCWILCPIGFIIAKLSTACRICFTPVFQLRQRLGMFQSWEYLHHPRVPFSNFLSDGDTAVRSHCVLLNVVLLVWHTVDGCEILHQLIDGLSMFIHVYPIIHRVSTIQGGAEFLPSTVCAQMSFPLVVSTCPA